MNEITKEASKQSEKQSSQEAPKKGNFEARIGRALPAGDCGDAGT
jgi:hypothetical protein